MFIDCLRLVRLVSEPFVIFFLCITSQSFYFRRQDLQLRLERFDLGVSFTNLLLRLASHLL